MASRTVPEYDDLDNYAFDDADDPFKSPPPEPKDGGANKRKKAEALGLDEEVEVAKRVRAPRVKLDETRLLSEDGIPKLKRRAAGLNLKGKGHEFSDASRLLSFYQLWLDDLFPKAKFLDALAMVEKAGHKKRVVHQRLQWINEGKPKPWDDDQDAEDNTDPPAPQTDEVAPAQASPALAQQRPATPEKDDVPDEDDIYGATPQAQIRTQPQQPSHPATEEPEDDDLDALMYEADAATQAQAKAQQQKAKQTTEDFDDEEAAMAEMDGMW